MFLNILTYNILSQNPWHQRSLSWNELICVMLIFLISVVFLINWYNKILSKNNNELKDLDFPIYNSKDVFSQEIVGDSNFVFAEKTPSIISKIVVYLIVLIIVTNSMSKIIGQEYF